MSEKDSHWPGLSTDKLRRLEQKLCRLKNRRTLFHGNDPDIVKRAPVSLLGRVCREAFRFVDGEVSKMEGDTKRGFQKLLERKKVAKRIGDSKENFSKYTEGRMNDDLWIDSGRCVLSYLLSGSDDYTESSLDSDGKIVAGRILDYFYRLSGADKPSFAMIDRASSAHAWSYRELADELNWLARQNVLENAKYTLSYISGGPPFFEYTGKQHMLEAFKNCINAGVSVRFIFPAKLAEDSGHDHDASVRTVCGKCQYIAIDESYPTRTSFVTPETKYIYFQATSQDAALWLIRAQPNAADDDVESSPIALNCTRSERDECDKWLAAVQMSHDSFLKRATSKEKVTKRRKSSG